MRIASAPDSGINGFALRQLERSDVHAWSRYLCSEPVASQSGGHVFPEQVLLGFFDGFESNDASSPIRLAIVDMDDDALVGTIGFHSIVPRDCRAEIVYDLAPAYWGRGIANIVCRSVTEWGFRERGFERIQATIFDRHIASQKVVERSGFRYEGLLRRYMKLNGVPSDFRMYARIAAQITARES